MKTEDIIKELINGNSVVVPDSQKSEVQRRLREIKKNCTEVLSQIKNN